MANLLGVVVGGYCSLFGMLILYVTKVRMEHEWILFLLPFGGLAIVWVYRRLGIMKSRGTNRILESISSGEVIPLKATPLITFATAVTHLLGGSAGREGAALQIGGSIGNWAGVKLKFQQKDITVMTMCGMSAAFSALFGTPLAATVFSMEVISIGIMHYSAIVPCAVAAIVGANLSRFMGLAPEKFPVNDFAALDWKIGLGIMAFSILSALVSIIFCLSLQKTEILYQKYLKNPYVRILAGGILVIAVTLLLGSRDYNGAGMQMIERMAAGDKVWMFGFIAKIMLTALTLGAGFKGGEIVPTIFIGAAFGCVAAPVFGISASVGAAMGVCALFCGVTNCPLTAILLSFELFGFEGMPYFLIVAAISYRLSGYTSLYHGQKIMYSKSRPEYINRRP
ncbi:MAG: chloride channel protein [Clostridia bacterium]|nr:chloride channel protein [Clostridia bacterium]NCC44682.1 chloride channel protein [Clostridia bacterium]